MILQILEYSHRLKKIHKDVQIETLYYLIQTKTR